MNKFYVITNRMKDPDFQITSEIETYLKDHGKECNVRKEEYCDGPYHYTDPNLIPEGTECIIVLGGDGTLVQAAKDVVYLGIPLIGINLGNLGFLVEIDKTMVYQALDKLMAGDYKIENRMMLEATVYRDGEVVGRDIALNDVVVCRESVLRAVPFHNYVNDAYLNSYNADGIIVSTPTGCTGYSLSCGGPIVSPDAFMTIMTPIAPHTLNTRSIIFSPDDVITVELGEGKRQNQESGFASFDGYTSISIITGDRVVIKQMAASTKILKLNDLSFIEILRQKMRNN